MIAAKKKLEAGGDKEVLDKEISMCDNFQGAMKINLNSEYGASGNPYYRFFSIPIAEAVTTSGQLAIRWIQRDMNEFLNKLAKTTGEDFIIASDTDSMYLNLASIITPKATIIDTIRFMDKFCEEVLSPFIKKSFARLDEYINSFAPKMNMKREALCDAAIWTGKKHYMLNVWNNEGVEYDKPKLKIVGLEAVKAGSMGTAARDCIKQAYQIIIRKDIAALRAYTEVYRTNFAKLAVEDIALPISCGGLAKYADDTKIWGFKTPYHTKGALIYNHLLDKLDLTQRYPEIKDGEKVKFVYLKQPNPLQYDGISFINTLPREFDLHSYIDHDTMFNRSFIDPVTTILDAIGWQLEETSSIDQFMS
jgi:DNA polymerase elongation subunit (family B)